MTARAPDEGKQAWCSSVPDRPGVLRRWAKANGRRVRALHGGVGQGGMVLANSAPALLAQAARSLRDPTPAQLYCDSFEIDPPDDVSSVTSRRTGWAS